VAEHDFPKLAEHVGSTPRIKDNPPLIYHSDEAKEDEGSEELKAAWAVYRESLPKHVRVLFDRFHLCDMAIKVVGVGRVGTTCQIALFMAADDDAVPADQGGEGFGARTLCREESAQQPR